MFRRAVASPESDRQGGQRPLGSAPVTRVRRRRPTTPARTGRRPAVRTARVPGDIDRGTIETLRTQYNATLSDVEEALGGLQRSETLEESGAWAIADHDHVTDRIWSLIDDGQRELYARVTDERVAERSLRSQMADASERGLDGYVEAPSDDVADLIREDVPDATVATTALAGDTATVENKWLSRDVMVDRRGVLVGAMTDGTRPGQAAETANWARGQNHGLVVGLRHLLRARIDGKAVFD